MRGKTGHVLHVLCVYRHSHLILGSLEGRVAVGGCRMAPRAPTGECVECFAKTRTPNRDTGG